VKLEQQIGGQWQSIRGWGPEAGKQVEAGVECGGVYRWAVRAQDGAGTVGAWSSQAQFTVEQEAAPPPPPEPVAVAVPSPHTPHDGAELGCTSNVTLVWHPIEPPGGSVSYQVLLERQAEGDWESLGAWGPTSGKSTDVPVECNNVHRWSVRAQDGAGNFSEWSSWSTFAVTIG
jgi:hypothetical protein